MLIVICLLKYFFGQKFMAFRINFYFCAPVRAMARSSIG
jgi:hypothetical protein